MAVGLAVFAAWAGATVLVDRAQGPEGGAGAGVIGVLLAVGWLVVAPAALWPRSPCSPTTPGSRRRAWPSPSCA